MKPLDSGRRFGASFLSGLLWSGSGRGAILGLRTLTILFVASWLTPEEFGRAGIAIVIVNIIGRIPELGLTDALIQRREVTDIEISSVFWLTGVVCVLLCCAMAVCAGAIAVTMGAPESEEYVRWISLSVPFAGLTGVPTALLQRRMHFRELAVRDLLGEISHGVCVIAMTVTGFGALSLVAGVVCQRFVRCIVVWQRVAWRPRLSFSLSSIRPMAGFSFYHTLSSIGNQAIQNADYVVVSRFLGQEALGYYTMAFQLGAIPIQRLAGLLGYVAFPSFARVCDDENNLRSQFVLLLKCCGVVAGFFSIVALSASPCLVWVSGDKWSAAVMPLQVLGLASIMYAVKEIADSIYLAKGLTGVRLSLTATSAAMFLLLVFTFGLRFGVTGVSVCLVASLGLNAVLSMFCVGRALHASNWSLWRQIMPSICGVSFACVIVWYGQLSRWHGFDGLVFAFAAAAVAAYIACTFQDLQMISVRGRSLVRLR